MKFNLVSVGTVTAKGLSILFDEKKCTIKKNSDKMGVIIMNDRRTKQYKAVQSTKIMYGTSST